MDVDPWMPVLAAVGLAALLFGLAARKLRQPPLGLVGAGLAVAVIAWLARRGEIRLGIGKLVDDDRDLQVFAALILAIGMALLSGLLGLSTALGALLTLTPSRLRRTRSSTRSSRGSSTTPGPRASMAARSSRRSGSSATYWQPSASRRAS